jgi:hypothetical protein
MERAANPSVRSIARAIEATLDRRQTAEEAERVHEIEALRTELCASTDPRREPRSRPGTSRGCGSAPPES